MIENKITIPKGCRAIIEEGVVIIETIERIFKKGDIIVAKSGAIAILRSKGDKGFTTIAYLSRVCAGIIVGNTYSDVMELDHFATDTEKQILFDALANVGKEWDAEKLEVVDIDWPKNGDTYFYPYFDSQMYGETKFYESNNADFFRKQNNLFFRTKEEAIECTQEMLNSLKK